MTATHAGRFRELEQAAKERVRSEAMKATEEGYHILDATVLLVAEAGENARRGDQDEAAVCALAAIDILRTERLLGLDQEIFIEATEDQAQEFAESIRRAAPLKDPSAADQALRDPKRASEIYGPSEPPDLELFAEEKPGQKS